MKRMAGLLCAAMTARACASSAMARSGKLFFYPPRVTPNPAVQVCTADVPVYLDKSIKFSVVCPDPLATDWVKGKLKLWFDIVPEIQQKTIAPGTVVHDDGYELEAKPGEILIWAKTLQGVRYAMYTLRQSAERVSGGLTAKRYWLAQLKIKDAPKSGYDFRGLNLVWITRTTLEMERFVRLAAYYKYNYLVVHIDGWFVSKRFPWMNRTDAVLTQELARRLFDLGKDLGVTIIPACSLLSHAASAYEKRGTHPVLDVHPEYEPLFEPDGGFNFCLSNPEARRICREYVAEIHEAFGNPPFVHIGADEMNAPTCPTCRAVNYAGLIGQQITEISDLLRKRGARTMIWHDALLSRDDPRWKPYFYAGGFEGTEEMTKSLAKDIVICDWYYGNYAEGGKTDPGGYPTLDYFKSLGFDTITCPFHDMPAYKLQCAHARKMGLMGVMATTWDDGDLQLMRVIQGAANDIWGANPEQRAGDIQSSNCWRQMGWDSGVSHQRDGGYPRSFLLKF